MIYEKAQLSLINELVNMRIAYLNADYNGLDKSTIKKITSSLPSYFKKHLNKDLFAYIAREKNSIIATAFLLIIEKPANPSFITGKTGTVLNVFTNKTYRRRGISKTLMKMLLDDSRDINLDFVELSATEDGYNLYKNLGFKDVNSKYKEMKYIID